MSSDRLLMPDDSDSDGSEATANSTIESNDESLGDNIEVAKILDHKFHLPKDLCIKNLLDSDSEEDDNRINNTVISESKTNKKTTNLKKRSILVKTVRKSAAKAKEVIAEKMSHKQQGDLKQKIQSEKQRIEREQKIRVPYHKPKQYSLKEFLARPTLSKPLMDKTKERQKPMSSMLQLKMVGQNIESFAQKMKEREEEALEFFKSDSDSDEEAMSIAVEKNGTTNEQGKLIEFFDKKEEVRSKIVLVNPEILQQENKICKTTGIENIVPAQTSEVPIRIDLGPPAMIIRSDHGISKTPEDLRMDKFRDKYENKQPGENEKFRLIFPTLKTLDEMGSNNFVIDLESGSIQPRNLSGPEKLFQRYLKTVQKPKQKDSVCMNISRMKNGKIENQKVEFKLDKELELDHNRPGISREKLKKSIRQQIEEERIVKMGEKILKRVPKELEFEKNDNCKTDPEYSLISDEEKAIGDQESGDDIVDEVEDEEEIDEKLKGLKKSGFALLDNEAIYEYESTTISEDEDEESSSSSSSDDESGETTATQKGRILKAFEDSDDERNYNSVLKRAQSGAANIGFCQVADTPSYNKHSTDAMTPKKRGNLKETEIDPVEMFQRRESDDIFNTQPYFTFTEPSVSEGIRVSEIGDLLDLGASECAEKDLMDICSGQFPPTQPGSSQAITEPKQVYHDTLITRRLEEKVQSPVKNYRKLLESSEDEVDEIQSGVKERLKKKKRCKPKVKKLDFSDDEDEQQHAEEIEEESEEEQEEEDTLVEYDSEENEIEVKMNKKDRVKAAGAYFEDEAELSESEWGSADEDEKDLDKFDIELGDEDQFDQNKLREEVGRIHARRILDDDIKNVKKLQDMLFEDEENDGVGRDRKFRWKNQTEGFSMENDNAHDGELVGNDEHDDEDSEIFWRKMRHERETMLNKQSQKMEETISDDILLLDHTNQTVTNSNTSLFAKRKFKIIRGTSSMVSSPAKTDIAIKKDPPFLIKISNMKKFQNASFLSRGDQALTKIASFIARKDDEVTNVSSHGGSSMNFITIDKPGDSKKRKSDGNKQQELIKKRKIDTPKKQHLLDQL